MAALIWLPVSSFLGGRDKQAPHLLCKSFPDQAPVGNCYLKDACNLLGIGIWDVCQKCLTDSAMGKTTHGIGRMQD